MKNQMTPAIIPSFIDWFSPFLKYNTEHIITANTRLTGIIDSNNGRFELLSGKITNDTRKGMSQIKKPYPNSLTYLFISYCLPIFYYSFFVHKDSYEMRLFTSMYYGCFVFFTNENINSEKSATMNAKRNVASGEIVSQSVPAIIPAGNAINPVAV